MNDTGLAAQNSLSAIYSQGALYEAVYRGRGKDYAADAAAVAAVIRERCPDAVSLLDAACGTGAHLRHLVTEFTDVEGLDLAPSMLAEARARLPGVRFHRADMAHFRLDRTFSAVTCLFSSIGYLPTTAALESAVACFARHLDPGGVLVVEPWCFPERFTPHQVMSDLATVDGTTIARVSHATLIREGRACRIEAHYLVAAGGTDVRHFTDVHDLSLFRREEYEAAFTRAGCAVEYLPSPDGRGVGLFAGIRTAG